MNLKPSPYIIHSHAPIRICDLGGWTDTWFAEYGSVLNIGVAPCAEVQLSVQQATDGNGQVVIDAEDFGDRYLFDLSKYSSKLGWNRHPLLEAAVEYLRPPDGLLIEITIHSKIPPGAATGTSAAVTVALLGALDALTPGRLSPHQLAVAAQKVETELLGQQCGVQDQLCCAYGGINYIEIEQYPHAKVQQLDLQENIRTELERRLVVLYLGKSHASSETHEMVIEAMEGMGPDNRYLQALRGTAPRGRDALLAGEFSAFGRTMIDNHEAQRDLHADLISPEADRIIEVAQAHGVLGWKVNGAGGDGGSVTLLCGPRAEIKQTMIREIEAEVADSQYLPTSLNLEGVRVWKSPDNR